MDERLGGQSAGRLLVCRAGTSAEDPVLFTPVSYTAARYDPGTDSAREAVQHAVQYKI